MFYLTSWFSYFTTPNAPVDVFNSKQKAKNFMITKKKNMRIAELAKNEKKLVKGKHYITYIDLIYALKPNLG